jgi:uncharacterized Zn-finger protein
MVTHQSSPATSPNRILQSLSPAISRSKRPIGHLLLVNVFVNLLTCLPCPTGIRLLKTTISLLSSIAYCIASPENTFPVAPEKNFSPFSLCFSQPSQATIIPTNDCLICRYFTVMAPKSKRTEAEENPFLPSPVDLDRIHLADKDHLIADTRCEFDFANLQSWLKEVFLDQSEKIGLWESNLPLYLFP